MKRKAISDRLDQINGKAREAFGMTWSAHDALTDGSSIDEQRKRLKAVAFLLDRINDDLADLALEVDQ